MKKIAALAAIVLMFGCKSKAVLATAKAGTELPATEIISNHYKSDKDFRTLYLKTDARYEDKDQTQNVSAEIRIRKDEKILVSVRFLGITMAKALITPEEVKYYEKINGEYFEGDFTKLSQWLGTELDFQKVQNLFIGLAMDDLRSGNYDSTIDDKLYKLTNTSGGIEKSFFFEAGRYLLMKEELNQPSRNRMLKVEYPDHSEYPQKILPTGIRIEAMQKKGKVNISIDYKSAAFNEELTFPYSVPEGYERIFID